MPVTRAQSRGCLASGIKGAATAGERIRTGGSRVGSALRHYCKVPHKIPETSRPLVCRAPSERPLLMDACTKCKHAGNLFCASERRAHAVHAVHVVFRVSKGSGREPRPFCLEPNAPLNMTTRLMTPQTTKMRTPASRRSSGGHALSDNGDPLNWIICR
jgi:hypothetical protein